MTTSAAAVARTATTSAAEAQTTSAARTASASKGKDGISQQERKMDTSAFRVNQGECVSHPPSEKPKRVCITSELKEDVQ